MDITKEMRYGRSESRIKTIKYLCQKAQGQTPTTGSTLYSTMSLSSFVK